MIPTKLIALVIVTFALAGLMIPAGVSNTAFAQGADEIIENVESVSEEITAFLEEDDDDNGEEEEEDDNGGDGVDEQGDDNQNLEQAIDQEQENEQNIEQSADEENEQSNTLTTGDNTATNTQANAADQAVEAAAAESGDAESESEEEDKSDGKHYSYSDSSTSTTDAESIATATAEATGIIDQVNENEVEQDSTANDNVLVNENEFGDDTQIAVPISDQDQTAENRAINLDIEQQPATPTDDGVPPPPEEQDAFFCITGLGTTICFESLAECESLQVGVPFCQRFETFPEGAVLCTVEEGLPVCQV